MDAVFVACQRAVRDLGYKIDVIDRANGLLNFKTGMSWSSWAGQEMSVTFMDNGNGTIEVSVSGRRSQSGVVLQVYDWGESKKIAKKVLAKVDKLVDDSAGLSVATAPVVAPTTPQTRDERECPFCAERILKKAKVCKYCGRDVVPPASEGDPPTSRHQEVTVTPNPNPNSPSCSVELFKFAFAGSISSPRLLLNSIMNYDDESVGLAYTISAGGPNQLELPL